MRYTAYQLIGIGFCILFIVYWLAVEFDYEQFGIYEYKLIIMGLSITVVSAESYRFHKYIKYNRKMSKEEAKITRKWMRAKQK